MTAPEPRAGLTEAEREVLSASIDRDDLPGLYGSMITAVETIIAARLAARDAEWVSKVEALADAVEWCRTDLIYKAPEQYTAVAPSHLAGIAGRLRALLADMQEGHDG